MELNCVANAINHLLDSVQRSVVQAITANVWFAVNVRKRLAELLEPNPFEEFLIVHLATKILDKVQHTRLEVNNQPQFLVSVWLASLSILELVRRFISREAILEWDSDSRVGQFFLFFFVF
jgi:hypothetical protein